MKTKVNIVFKTAIATFLLSSGLALANENKVVNDYDCSLPELREYVAKKTDYFVNAQSSIPTWEEFKRQDLIEGAGTGEVPKDGNSSPATGQEEKCDYFWGDISDWDANIEEKVGSISDSIMDGFDSLKSLLSGDYRGALKTAYSEAEKVMLNKADQMISEVKKGLCKRLSRDNVERELYRAADKYISSSSAMNGIPKDLVDQNFNGYINDVLTNSFGSTGKLLNINDSKLDTRRNRFINNEIDRQLDVLKVF